MFRIFYIIFISLQSHKYTINAINTISVLGAYFKAKTFGWDLVRARRLRYYATLKVRKFFKVNRCSTKLINTFLQKTTTCIRRQTEQISSVNI